DYYCSSYAGSNNYIF
nr:immunoglobulin light chain junction region [Macaca mulatta]MOW02169.1 immunoglobulin light chain junction region [Macaca mulatta]MOW03342.1 immunoglobulin light chain junction region [Macaca mulatta]